ncbi:MAG: HAMP domain-containing histidine kinase [Deltaproteobacteria bacterium]|nr:HAMP domain-containing histidine kinase [Deltaproteobacteria bacterium]
MGETNRGVQQLAHDLRIPINSILALSQILLGRLDGDLTEEQDRQLRLIRQSVEEMSRMVDDMLDLARLEAGKAAVRPRRFRVEGLFRALSGVFGPLAAQSPSVSLSFELIGTLPPLDTDEEKVARILRNLVSNALKFTEQGAVRVSARHRPADDMMVFDVSDTGIGIPPSDAARIFEEFTQLDSRLQGRSKGSGLGLPLSRRLAEILGGSITVESETGLGSTFRAVIPVTYREQVYAASGCGGAGLSEP